MARAYFVEGGDVSAAEALSLPPAPEELLGLLRGCGQAHLLPALTADLQRLQRMERTELLACLRMHGFTLPDRQKLANAIIKLARRQQAVAGAEGEKRPKPAWAEEASAAQIEARAQWLLRNSDVPSLGAARERATGELRAEAAATAHPGPSGTAEANGSRSATASGASSAMAVAEEVAAEVEVATEAAAAGAGAGARWPSSSRVHGLSDARDLLLAAGVSAAQADAITFALSESTTLPAREALLSALKACGVRAVGLRLKAAAVIAHAVSYTPQSAEGTTHTSLPSSDLQPSVSRGHSVAEAAEEAVAAAAAAADGASASRGALLGHLDLSEVAPLSFAGTKLARAAPPKPKPTLSPFAAPVKAQPAKAKARARADPRGLIGSSVLIHGLSARPELNGTCAPPRRSQSVHFPWRRRAAAPPCHRANHCNPSRPRCGPPPTLFSSHPLLRPATSCRVKPGEYGPSPPPSPLLISSASRPDGEVRSYHVQKERYGVYLPSGEQLALRSNCLRRGGWAPPPPSKAGDAASGIERLMIDSESGMRRMAALSNAPPSAADAEMASGEVLL